MLAIDDFLKKYNEKNPTIITGFFQNEIINKFVPMSNPNWLHENTYYLWCNIPNTIKNQTNNFIQLDKKTIYVVVAHAHNHFHHNFTEVLMILQIYLNDFEKININNEYNFKIVSSKSCFAGHEMTEIVKLFDFETKITWVEDDKFYKGNFLYIKHVGGKAEVPHGLGYIKPCLPRNKSTIFIELIKKANKKYNGSPFYKKLWISRRNLVGNWNKRIITNINDVAQDIINSGFHEMYFSNKYDFLYQIYLVNSAEIIFVEFGSGLINMLFCKEKTTIITTWCPSNYMMCTFYEEMGNILNHKYYLYKNFITDTESNIYSGGDWNEPYKIKNIEEFKKWIFNITNQHMDTFFFLGENSFIAKHLYIQIKKLSIYNVVLLNHNNYEQLKTACDSDIVINFCGVNRSSSEIEYEEGNHMFLQKIINTLSCRPFLIHVSSLMVYGFKNKCLDTLSNYQQWFIKSKLNGEQYLCENYPKESLCIIRPSNIYGYDCTPYYNNLLSTLVYEKICGLNKINNINTNCFRNMLSVENLTDKMCDFILKKKFGTYNLMSNNTISLDVMIKYIYDNEIPTCIVLNNGDQDIPNTLNNKIVGVDIIINEDLHNKIKLLEENMKIFIQLKENIPITTRSILVQPRGNMVEISSLSSNRLYKITLTQNSVRGNHYHDTQIEEFYTNKDKVLYLFAYANNPTIIYQYISKVNDLVIVKPTIIHTLTNDFINNDPEIIISSTQEFIADKIPDTEYINII